MPAPAPENIRDKVARHESHFAELTNRVVAMEVTLGKLAEAVSSHTANIETRLAAHAETIQAHMEKLTKQLEETSAIAVTSVRRANIQGKTIPARIGP